jgi:hypothetical protein
MIEQALNNRMFGDNARSSGADHHQLSLLWHRLPAIVSLPNSSLVGSAYPFS